MPGPVQPRVIELHYPVDVVSRGAGQSAVARSCYQQRAAGRDEYDGKRHNYSRKKPPAFRYMTGFRGSHVQLWNSAGKAENTYANKPDKAQLAHSFVLALPRELGLEGWIRCVIAYAAWHYDKTRAPSSYVLHIDDEGNPHMHGMHAQRAYDLATGEWSRKKHDFFNKFRGNNGLEEARAFIASMFNAELELVVKGVRVEHESFAKRGIKQEPTKHLGPAAHYRKKKEEEKAAAAAVKGEVYEPDLPDRCAANDRIRARNRRRKEKEDTAMMTPGTAASAASPQPSAAGAGTPADTPLVTSPVPPQATAAAAAATAQPAAKPKVKSGQKFTHEQRTQICDRLAASPHLVDNFTERVGGRKRDVERRKRIAEQAARDRQQRSGSTDETERATARAEFAVAGRIGSSAKLASRTRGARGKRRDLKKPAQTTTTQKLAEAARQDVADQVTESTQQRGKKPGLIALDFGAMDRLGDNVQTGNRGARARTR